MTHRSKWTLLGKLVLFCLLLPHAHTEGETSAEEQPEREPEPPSNSNSPQDKKPDSSEATPKSSESGESKNSDEHDKEEAEKELGDGLPFTKGHSKHFKNITGYSYGFSQSEGKEDSWKSYPYPYANPGQLQAPYWNQGGYYGGAAPAYQDDYSQNGQGFGQGAQPFGQGTFVQGQPFGQGSFGQGDYGQPQPDQWQYNQNGVQTQIATGAAMLNVNPAFQMLHQYSGPGGAALSNGNIVAPGTGSGANPMFETSMQLGNLPPGENPLMGSLSTLSGGPAPGANPFFHSVQTFRVESLPNPTDANSLVKAPILQQGIQGTKPANLNMFNSNMFSRTSRGK